MEKKSSEVIVFRIETRSFRRFQKYKSKDISVFDDLMELITNSTIEYLSQQILAGAEVVKLFDSWAGSLRGPDFKKYALEPTRRIIKELKHRHPSTPIIAFPREAGENYIGFAKATGADCVALDESVSAIWAADNVQIQGCVQGNLAARHMVIGGQDLIDGTEEDVLKSYNIILCYNTNFII